MIKYFARKNMILNKIKETIRNEISILAHAGAYKRLN